MTVRPPETSNYNEYFNWLTNHLQPATTDEQIEELMEMSMAGTLMIYAPGAAGSEMQQVYTDENGHITVSKPLNEMDGSDRGNVPADRRLPNPPGVVLEPNPADYGLRDFPPKPVRPQNMNPGFFSWFGYIFGISFLLQICFCT